MHTSARPHARSISQGSAKGRWVGRWESGSFAMHARAVVGTQELVFASEGAGVITQLIIALDETEGFSDAGV